MVLTYYLSMFIIATICSAIYFWRWHKNCDISFTLIYVLMPLATIGYVMVAVSPDVGAAMSGTKFIYLGGVYMELVITISIFSLGKIKLPRWAICIALLASSFIYAGALSTGFDQVFYKKVTIIKQYGISVLDKEYGPVHALFYPLVILYVVIGLGTLIYAFKKKPDASRTNLSLMVVTQVVTVFAFFVGRMITEAVEWVPVAYAVDAIVYLIIMDRTTLYSMDDTILETLLNSGDVGYVSFDFRQNFLGATDKAKFYLPTLQHTFADKPIADEEIRNMVDKWILDFLSDEVTREQYYENNGRIYKIEVKYLYDGKRVRGFQMRIEDDTDHQQYLHTLESYNKNLKEELTLKTKLLEEYQSKV